ncbi:hypothetical protein PTKIN_Ptkin08bG0204100 [Pterospermum kingtungense]
MPDSKDLASSPKVPSKRLSWPLLLFSSAMLPVIAAVVVYHLDSFDAAPMPLHELSQPPEPALLRNDRMLQGAELLGVGKFQGPEDIAYDPESEVIYTGSGDGWIKRVWLNESASDSVVENWVSTGGRPLGVALGLDNEVIVADAYKGLLNISREGAVEVLADEAEGLRFKFTDGVDVAKDGVIYFTDASQKYSFHEFARDVFEGRPYGRLLSYDPVSKRTQVLLTDIYFPNGVAVSPNQEYLVFCETSMRRCKKYYIQGNKKGHVEKFIDNLPGMPDNIRYDGEGHYWIALATENTMWWDLAFKYPLVRKALAIIERAIGRVHMEKNSGVLAVDMGGKPVAQYRDVELNMISTGMKIKKHLYCGSVFYPYIIRLNLDQHGAEARS